MIDLNNGNEVWIKIFFDDDGKLYCKRSQTKQPHGFVGDLDICEDRRKIVGIQKIILKPGFHPDND